MLFNEGRQVGIGSQIRASVHDGCITLSERCSGTESGGHVSRVVVIMQAFVVHYRVIIHNVSAHRESKGHNQWRVQYDVKS